MSSRGAPLGLGLFSPILDAFFRMASLVVPNLSAILSSGCRPR